MNKTILKIVALTLYAIPTVCSAHGPNMEVGVSNGQLVTTHYFNQPNESYMLNGQTVTGENYNPYYAGQSVRMVGVTMVQDNLGGTTGFTSTTANSPSSSNNGWYGQNLNDGSAPFTGPGLAYGANADIAGNPVSNGFTASPSSPLVLTETLLGPLQQWNGSTFVISTTERLQGIRGSLGGLSNATLFTDPTGSEAGSWSTSQMSLTPDSHNQVEWRLDTIGTEVADVNALNGIYLATLTVGSNEGGTSLPFYFLFEKNDGAIDSTTWSNEVAAAESYAQDTLAPEPSSFGMIAVAGIAMAVVRRPRRVR